MENNLNSGNRAVYYLIHLNYLSISHIKHRYYITPSDKTSLTQRLKVPLTQQINLGSTKQIHLFSTKQVQFHISSTKDYSILDKTG